MSTAAQHFLFTLSLGKLDELELVLGVGESDLLKHKSIFKLRL